MAETHCELEQLDSKDFKSLLEEFGKMQRAMSLLYSYTMHCTHTLYCTHYR
jgi:hypothetical protein